MPFQITVTGATLEECIVELVNTARSIALQAAEPVQAAPAPQVEAPVQAPEPAPAPAPAAQAKPADNEAMRVEIRTILTAAFRGSRAAEAKALLKRYGDGLSSVDDDSLPALLNEAKEFA